MEELESAVEYIEPSIPSINRPSCNVFGVADFLLGHHKSYSKVKSDYL
jgi:hypothetical protein